MLKTEIAYTSADGIHKIVGTVWTPDNKQDIKAVLQISHGMQEHIERYEDFAGELVENGYAVVGNNHLGHGRTGGNKENLGYFTKDNPSETAVKDLYILTRKAGDMFKNKPIFLLGHSMGSFLARRYIMNYGKKLAGVIIIGTGTMSEPYLKTGRFLTKVLGKIHGDTYRSNFINKLVFGNYNKKIKKNDTGSWLTKDQKIVNKYNKDPYCNFVFTLNGFYMLFETISFVQKKENIKKIPKTLPVYLMAGRDDPVGNYGKGVIKTYKSMVQAGIEDISIKLYKNDRHEIINETDRQQVYGDILKWLDSHIVYDDYK